MENPSAPQVPPDTPAKPGLFTDPVLGQNGVLFGFRYWEYVAIFLLVLSAGLWMTLTSVEQRSTDREFFLRAAYQFYSENCTEDCLYLANYTPVLFPHRNINPLTADQYALEGRPATVRQWLDYVGGSCEHWRYYSYYDRKYGCPGSIDNGTTNVTYRLKLIQDWEKVG